MQHRPKQTTTDHSPNETTTDHSPNVHQQRQCPLFSLPSELRLSIYELVFLLPEASAPLGYLPSPHHLAILQTCRLVLHEAEEIYYSLHRFTLSLPTVPHLRSLLRALPSARRDAIADIEIYTSSASEVLAAVLQLRLLPGLRSVWLRRDLPYHRLGPVHQWLELGEGLREALEKLANREGLRDVRVITPKTENLTEKDERRFRRLRGVDQGLEGVCGSGAVGHGEHDEHGGAVEQRKAVLKHSPR